MLIWIVTTDWDSHLTTPTTNVPSPQAPTLASKMYTKAAGRLLRFSVEGLNAAPPPKPAAKLAKAAPPAKAAAPAPLAPPAPLEVFRGGSQPRSWTFMISVMKKMTSSIKDLTATKPLQA